MSTARLLHALRLSAFVILTLTVHAWFCLGSYALFGWLGAFLMLCAPVLGWVGWVVYLGIEGGSISKYFTVALGVWLFCAALVWMAGWRGGRGIDRGRVRSVGWRVLKALPGFGLLG